MIFKKLLWAFIFALLLSPVVKAQDWHFSQIDAVPTMHNAALTGLVNGSMRASVVYRNQWSFAAKFNTFALSVDAPVARLKNNDLFGIGFTALSDRAGDLNFSTTEGHFAMAYHKSLNSYGNHYLSAGFQGGLVRRSVNYNAVRSFDVEPGSLLSNDQFTYYDLGAGLNWFILPNSKTWYYMGAAVHHLNEPNQSFLDDGSNLLYQRYSLYGGAQWTPTDMIYLIPGMIYFHQGPNNELNAGAYMKWWLNHNSRHYVPERSVYVGLWYRYKDAVIVSTRMDYKDFNIGLSYDLNVSSLTPASNLNGGLEVSVIYLLNKTAITPNRSNIACPKFF